MSIQTIHGRLAEARLLSGMSQAELADAAGTTQPAISQILRGERSASAEMLGRICAALGCSTEWVLTGKGESLDGRPTAEAEWHFRKAYGDGTRAYGNPAAEVFEPSISSAVREGTQNSNDAARRDGSKVLPVRVEISLIELTGAHLEDFLKAIEWNRLRHHYERIAEDQKHRGARRVRAALRDLDEQQRLLLFRIEDYNSTGLLGSDVDDSPFSALVRRGDDSYKEGISAGGRYGLGKNAVARLSQFDLMLFSSDLAIPEGNHRRGRFIGRAFFPYHSLGKTNFEGFSFFGAPDPNEENLRLSIWNAHSTITPLFLNREVPDDFEGEVSGTSIMAVGLPYATDDGEPAASAYAEEALESVCDAFWPAIASGRLSVAVSQYKNSKLTDRKIVNPRDRFPELFDLLDDAASLTEAISNSESPTVIFKPVQLTVPSKIDEDEPYQHDAKLVIRRLSLEDYERFGSDAAHHVNCVAMWRKPGMVVSYEKYNLGYGAAPFQALLLAGEAAGSTAADQAAEAFLAFSEPPSHDEWSADSPDLLTVYRRGARKNLRDFHVRIKNVLSDALRAKVDRTQDGPEDLKRLLTLPVETDGQRSSVKILSYEYADDGSILVTVRCPRAQKVPWRFSAALFSRSESGGPVRIPADLSAVRNAKWSEGSIEVPDSAKNSVIALKPDWSSTKVDKAYAALFVEVLRAEPVKSEAMV